MKKTILSIILTYFFIGPNVAQKVEDVIIESKELDQTRELFIYTPMSYEASEYSYYNVIYVFDAHDRALFDYVSSVAHLLKEGHRGFVVVGIKATFIMEKMYGRNHDLLPSDTKRNLGPKSGGNAEAFLAYIKNEVVPYVESNYRTLPYRTAVGHSLSASFITYSLLNETELFDNYIAISPNLADDDQRLVRGLKNFDSKQFETLKFFYMSHADEAENENYFGWRSAYENAFPILRNSLASENFKVMLEEYPEESHRSGFIPSVKSAMLTYIETIEPEQNKLLSKEKYKITLRVKVPGENDEIYVTGNQEKLGNWEPGKIKMQRVSSDEREITLKVQDPVELKFTRGNWESEAWMKIEDGVGGKSNFPIIIRPSDGVEYTFEIVGFMN
jgi:predicted alpha/beta superfamily hydrolase